MPKNSEVKRVLTVPFKVSADKDSKPEQYTANLDYTGVTLDEAIKDSIPNRIIELQRVMRKDGIGLYPKDKPVEVNVKAALSGRGGAIQVTTEMAQAHVGGLSLEERAKFMEMLKASIEADEADEAEVKTE